MAVLFTLLSLVTWVPNLALFFLQAGLAKDWLIPNLRIGQAILVGSLIWVAFLCLLALALSAWVRRRLAATVLMCGIFFAGAGLGDVARHLLKSPWGRVVSLAYLIDVVWRKLFGIVTQPPRRRMPSYFVMDLPTWGAWGVLLGLCALCLILLDRRVRAKEIVA